MMERLTGMRYVVPLREGGSLPAVFETGPCGQYVVKFRGAGQGAKALIAESLAAGLAQALGLPVPRPAIVALDDGFGKGEPDPEIQDIPRGSVGANFGLTYLAGALAFDPAVDRDVSFDAFITNVDRTARNTNLLLWRGQLWLIDHGASLYVHHRWEGWEDRIQAPFPRIRDHVLLAFAVDLEAADARLGPRLTEEAIRGVVADLPDEWLGDEVQFPALAAHRAAYVSYLAARLHGPRHWLQEAIDAKRRGPAPFASRLTHRVV